ncbi:MAG: DUF2029 domain-containing protein [Candidatus Omnitrophica bacterium]|nr:DUF2029 domain-containing protein [Candidatus Omnitrophota bacterium]
MRNWGLGAALILFAVAVLAVAQWPAFPYFLDSYYHLSVIQGFREAGGPVLHAFWEAAPEGRVHLYPPLFHLSFLPLAFLKVPPLVMAKLWCWAALPALLWAAWSVLCRTMTPRIAFLSTACLAAPYSFFLSAANYPPANAALTVGLGLILALHRQRWIAGGLILGITFLLHAGIPWLLALSLILFGLLEKPYRKTAWASVGLGLLVASPWLIHIAGQISLLKPQPRGEDRFFESSVLLAALGLWGFAIAVRRRGIVRFLPALAVGFLPMAFLYRFRFFSAQGLFPLLLLAAVALDQWLEKKRPKWVLGAVVAALLLAAPSLRVSGEGWRWVWGDTTLSVLSGRETGIPRPTAQPLFNPHFMGELGARVKAHTKPDELVFSNFPYLAGMMNVTTGRAITNEMLREFEPRSLEAQILPARLIVWMKEGADLPPNLELQRIVERYRLEPLGSTEIAFLYRNPFGEGRRPMKRAAIPWWLAEGIILLLAGGAVWDLRRRKA